MSNAARKLDASAAVPIDWSRMVSIGEAADKLGISSGQMRRRAAEKLQRQGLAVYANPPGGGTPRWFIDRRYDLKLSDRVGEQYQDTDISQYSKRQRDGALMRARCVELFRHARSTQHGRQADWLPGFVQDLQNRFENIRISQRSLLRWYQLYQTPSDIVKLIDFRGGDQKSQGDPAAWNHFKQVYLDERQPSIKTCWKRVKEFARVEQVQWCSYHSCRRQLDDRIDVEVQVKHRDPKRWRSQFAPYIEQDTERFAAGECWVGDHRPLDLLCRIGDRIFRPFITTWQDWRTRKIVGWTMCESPNSSTILAALRSGILDPSNRGGPGVVWIDNGKDYDSYTFHGQTKQQRRQQGTIELDEDAHAGLFGRLNIEAHFSVAYNPQGKARMERWFATVGDRFDKTFHTYTGKDTVTKPEQLKDLVKQADKVPQFHHVRDRFADFVVGYNHDVDHTIDDLVDSDGTRLAPADAMARWCDVERVMADAGSLDLLLMQYHKPIRVGRNGITLSVAGARLKYGQFSDPLRRFKGTREEVHVGYDPEDMRQVRVFDSQWRFVAEVDMNQRGGRHADPLNRDHVAAVARRKSAHRRRLKQVRKDRQAEYLSDQELLADEVANTPKPTEPTAHPTRLKIVRTPVDGQSKALEKHRQRKAAGAEHYEDDHDDDDDLAGIGSLAKLGGNGGGDFDDDEPLSLADAATVADDDEDDMDMEVLDLRDDHIDTDDDDDPHILDTL